MRQPLKPPFVGIVFAILTILFLSLLIRIYIRDGELGAELMFLSPILIIVCGTVSVVSIYGTFARAGKFIEGSSLVRNTREQMLHCRFLDTHGLDGIKDGSFCTVYADEENKRIIFDAEKNGERFLPFEQVVDIRAYIPTKEVQKSVIGRAAVGAVVAGPVGAVVGGMSGQGTKTVKGDIIFEIDYRRKDSSEICTISLRKGVSPIEFKDKLRIAIGFDKPKSQREGYTKGNSDYL